LHRIGLPDAVGIVRTQADKAAGRLRAAVSIAPLARFLFPPEKREFTAAPRGDLVSIAFRDQPTSPSLTEDANLSGCEYSAAVQLYRDPKHCPFLALHQTSGTSTLLCHDADAWFFKPRQPRLDVLLGVSVIFVFLGRLAEQYLCCLAASEKRRYQVLVSAANLATVGGREIQPIAYLQVVARLTVEQDTIKLDSKLAGCHRLASFMNRIRRRHHTLCCLCYNRLV
jgi:hypothetical protein